MTDTTKRDFTDLVDDEAPEPEPKPKTKTKVKAKAKAESKPKGTTLTYVGHAAEVANQGQVFVRDKAVDITGRETRFAVLMANPRFKVG